MKNSTLFTRFFSKLIELGNYNLTVTGLFLRKDKDVFAKIEILTLILTCFSALALFWIDDLSFLVGLFVCLVLAQRVLEYLIVYSRNFIFGAGRVFTNFPDKDSLGPWLIIMFLINLMQVVLSFAVCYRFLSVNFPDSFSQNIGAIDSFYISMVTFFTLGFGDIYPVGSIAKLLVAFESFLSFYTFLIVINGLITMHFSIGSNIKK